jgi:hypothetical protein
MTTLVRPMLTRYLVDDKRVTREIQPAQRSLINAILPMLSPFHACCLLSQCFYAYTALRSLQVVLAH